jgi:hypothetical protein
MGLDLASNCPAGFLTLGFLSLATGFAALAAALAFALARALALVMIGRLSANRHVKYADPSFKIT